MTDELGTPCSEATESPDPSALSRRSLLGGALTAGSASLFLGGGAVRTAGAQTASQGAALSVDPATRPERSYRIRLLAAGRNYAPPAPHASNGDETLYADRRASYSKGLPHDGIGEVDPTAWTSFRQALDSGRPQEFETIVMGNPGGSGPPAGLTPVHRLINPQGGLAYDMQGVDAHLLLLPPAPQFASAWLAGEIVENYWMAHLRDVPFDRYVDDPLAQQALAEINGLSDYRGPRDLGGTVTAQELFRDPMPGCLVGPYVSQFFRAPLPFGTQEIGRQMRTALPGVDYMTTQADWLARQNGVNPASSPPDDPTPVYVRNGRDLGQWVHVDVLFQAYQQAFLAMAALGVPDNPGNPYGSSSTQVGFVSFGGPNFIGTMCELATRALKAAWFQKWFVHRRLRPEVFAGRVHVHLSGQKSYDIHADALGSQAAALAFSRNGTHLLPMAFPEGSPSHPAYSAGHATVAGACTTILKAMFDTERPVTDFFQPLTATDDGLALVPYTGADAGSLTIEGELNKIASNVSTGRNHAGVHWRTDAIESLRLGEEVAIRVLRDHKLTFNEPAALSFNRFDGTRITI